MSCCVRNMYVGNTSSSQIPCKVDSFKQRPLGDGRQVFSANCLRDGLRDGKAPAKDLDRFAYGGWIFEGRDDGVRDVLAGNRSSSAEIFGGFYASRPGIIGEMTGLKDDVIEGTGP